MLLIAPHQPGAPIGEGAETGESVRVLHIYKDVYPPTCGGIEIAIRRIIEATRDACEAISVLICSRNRKSEFAEVEGTPVYKAGEWGRFLSAPVSPYFPYWLKRLQTDILHYHVPNPTAVISHLLVRPRGKVVVHYHSDIVRQEKWLKLYGPLRDRFLRKADVILATSPNYLESSDTLRRFRDKCAVIPFGVPVARFAPTGEIKDLAQVIRRRYGTGLVLFVGILRYYKGLHYLIEAMQHVEGKLVIVGDGPLLPGLIAFAQKQPHAERIIFVGQVESVVPYYYAADVFCLPSIYRSEAFGLVLVEAAACGLPLVSTELGTGTSYVNRHGETGLVVPPQDPAALAGALNTLLANPNLRHVYGAAARRRVQDLFTQEAMGRQILETYRRILERE
ncbi:MAG TPA: glycosyltransferase [bacterium]|nr:glycosyltransferase [bacterium]HPP00455.1 glycosyltransferase [bacterium]